MRPTPVSSRHSWIDERLERCFQLMETNNPALFHEWIAHWSDLADFEIVPVISSEEAAARPRGGGPVP